MSALIDAVAAAGTRLQRSAADIGARLDFDPVAALTRSTPHPLSPPGRWSPNRHCRLVEASDGWIAVNLARDADRDAVPAWLESPIDADPWASVIACTRSRRCADVVDRAILLHMPVTMVGETVAGSGSSGLITASKRQRKTLKAIDLSALWAGPYCAGLLAEAGVAVTKIESPARPDPTGPDMRLNGSKRRLTMDLASAAAGMLIADSDILVTGARPHALARLGLTPKTLFTANPDLIWVAITAHGWTGDGAMRVGFGDDCAAAGGLVGWDTGEPHFLGDALADPLTGIEAATLAFQALAANEAGLIDVSLAQTAAAFAARL
jgi:CoA-transferase family III